MILEKQNTFGLVEEGGIAWGHGNNLIKRMNRHVSNQFEGFPLTHQEIIERIFLCNWVVELLDKKIITGKAFDSSVEYELEKILVATNFELFLSKEWFENFKQKKPWEKILENVGTFRESSIVSFQELMEKESYDLAFDVPIYGTWSPVKHNEVIAHFWLRYFAENLNEFCELVLEQGKFWKKWLEKLELPENALFFNTKVLGKSFGLNPLQCQVWGWLEILINQGYGNQNILGNILAHTIYIEDVNRLNPFLARVSKVIGISYKEVEYLLSTSSPLIKMGWFKSFAFGNQNAQWPSVDKEDFVWFNLAQKWSNEHDSRELLCQSYQSESEVTSAFLVAGPPAVLKIDNWSHLKEVDLLLKALSQKKVCEKEKEQPVRILLWGPPGTGKTSLACALFEKAGLSCVIPPHIQTSEIDFSRKRFQQLFKTQHLASLIPQSALLIDECEHYWKSDAKADLVYFLNNTQVPQIWIANDVNDCNPAWLRRFDLVIQIKEMPFETRLKIAQEHFEDKNLAYRSAQTINTPAGLVGAASWCKKSEAYTWENVYHYLSGQQKVLRIIEKEKDIPASISHPSHSTLPPFAGYESLLKLQADLVDMVENPEIYRKLKAKTPKGIFLSGPPGTGKTLFAQNLAASMGIPMLVGQTSTMAMFPESIKSVFKEARAKAPCILFLDEADVLFPRPKTPVGIDTQKQTILNAMLTEMDGTESLEGVLIVAATHRDQDQMDEAVFRSGRLSEKIILSLPDEKERLDILKAYLVNTPTEELDDEILQSSTVSMTGADLSEVVSKASLLSARARLPRVTQETIEQACTEVFWGVGSSGEGIRLEDRFRTAIHEAGHALIALRHGLKVPRVSIRPRANSLGLTQWHEDENKVGRSKQESYNIIELVFGGIAAEKVYFGDYENGGSSDLSVARRTLRNMISKLGFSSSFGSAALDLNQLSERHLVKMEDEEDKIQAELFENCVNWLKSNFSILESCAHELLEAREISGHRLKKWKDLLLSSEEKVYIRTDLVEMSHKETSGFYAHPAPSSIQQDKTLKRETNDKGVDSNSLKSSINPVEKDQSK